MTNGFDGTEELTYAARRGKDVPLYLLTPQCINIDGMSLNPELQRGFGVEYLMTDKGPAVGFIGPPPDDVIDCIAEVRNVKEDIMNAKVAASLCDDDPEMLGSCDPYDGVDETLMGCAGEIAEALQ